MLSELVGKTILTCSTSHGDILIGFGDNTGINVSQEATNLDENDVYSLKGQKITSVIYDAKDKIVIQFQLLKDIIIEYNDKIDYPEIFLYFNKTTNLTIIM